MIQVNATFAPDSLF